METIEFMAFNNHYAIDLIPNANAIPSSIHHTNGIPNVTNINPFFTSLESTCHFYGKVLSDTTDPLQRVSLSLCPHRGVRGEIRAFNDTLYIKPSRYFLDLQHDSNRFHNLNDEHLVFRHSDYDQTGIPKLKSLRNGMSDFDSLPFDAVSDALNHRKTKNLDKMNKMRRRTLWNGGNTVVELYVMADPTMVLDFKSVYPSSWYQQLTAEMADYVNSVSSKYRAIDFNGWNIGTISVSLVELEVFTWFEGGYTSLYPNPLCDDYTNSQCTINGIDYLSKFDAFIKSKSTRNFDNAQLITKYHFANAGGYGWVGTICKVCW